MKGTELNHLAANVVLAPPDGYSFFGVERRVDDDIAVSQAALRGEEPLFRAQLELDLYQFAYARPPGPPVAKDPVALPATAVPDSPGPDRIETRTFTVDTALADGSVVVLVDGVRLRLHPGAFVGTASQARRLKPGDLVRRVDCRTQWGAQAAYHRITGGPRPRPFRPGTDLRFYWNAPIDIAPALLEGFTAALGRSAIPFLAKRLTGSGQDDRRDSVVLYIDRRDQAAAERPLRALHDAFASSLRDEVPMFTWQLGPGLGYAEDPASGASFGQERARLLADALEARDGQDAFDSTLASAFRLAGLDPERAHRNCLHVDRRGGPEDWVW
ncbi:MAG: T3SS effector HopA1 family protein [Azospirillaceae bacterium]